MSAFNRLGSILIICISVLSSWQLTAAEQPAFIVLKEVRYADRIEQKIRFSRPDGSKIEAYFLLPDLFNGRLDYPGIIYFDPNNGNTNTRLEEARQMAAWGAFCMVISETNNTAHYGTTDVSLAMTIMQQMPQLDPSRIAYVGFGAGVVVGDQMASTKQPFCGYLLNSDPNALNQLFQYRANASRTNQRRTVLVHNEHTALYADAFGKKTNAPVFHQVMLPSSLSSFDHSALTAIEASNHEHDTYNLADASTTQRSIRHRERWLRQLLRK